MNYLISSFDCIVKGKDEFTLNSFGKYILENIEDENCFVFSLSGEMLYSINLHSVIYKNCSNKYAIKIDYNKDTYIYLNQPREYSFFVTSFKYLNSDVVVSLSKELYITINGEKIISRDIGNVQYSNYEIDGNILIIYFSGVRNYVVVINNKELKYSEYYDEFNKGENEKYFMSRCYDSLNHGRVCHVKDKNVESYLVYLDDNELKLKDDFTHCVFLDCVLNKNYKYVHALMDKSLSDVEIESIPKFFPAFDNYFVLDNTSVALINKNTLTGIYKFDIENATVKNIVEIN